MDLQLVLLIFGVFAIVTILVHGLMTIHKNSQKRADRTEQDELIDDPQREEPSFSAEGFDEHGVGPVRVIKRQPDESEQDDDHPPLNDSPEMVEPSPAAANTTVSHGPSADPKSDKVPGHDPAVFPDPPSHLLRKGEESPASSPAAASKPLSDSAFLDEQPIVASRDDDFTLTETPLRATSEAKPAATTKPKRTKPVASQSERGKATRKRAREDQLRIDFDEEPAAEPSAEQGPPPQQEVLILNVKMPDEQTMAGAALLPLLLTLGFKFGDQNIFHRHVNSNGKGPVLFSLANMFQPGVFDIDNMENFTTRGVSLFMVLPIEGDPRQVFNMMHNASRKIADEFGAQILDGRRAVLTKQALQQYVDIIRESERQRMLHKA